MKSSGFYQRVELADVSDKRTESILKIMQLLLGNKRLNFSVKITVWYVIPPLADIMLSPLPEDSILQNILYT